MAAELAGEIARGSADAAADVEHALGAVDLRQLCQPYGGIAPARMELIDRREVVRRQVLDIFSRFLQRPQDDVAEGTAFQHGSRRCSPFSGESSAPLLADKGEGQVLPEVRHPFHVMTRSCASPASGEGTRDDNAAFGRRCL